LDLAGRKVIKSGSTTESHAATLNPRKKNFAKTSHLNTFGRFKQKYYAQIAWPTIPA
jgi:hypothetical protein